MRILSLDYGQKRIGLALSDALKMTAQPFGFLENKKSLWADLKKLVADQEVSEAVVGLPTSMSGSPNAMSKEVEVFAEKLKKELGIPVHLYDERLTSVQAERVLIEGNVRRENRKGARDAIAASLLLQAFLATRANQ